MGIAACRTQGLQTDVVGNLPGLLAAIARWAPTCQPAPRAPHGCCRQVPPRAEGFLAALAPSLSVAVRQARTRGSRRDLPAALPAPGPGALAAVSLCLAGQMALEN